MDDRAPVYAFDSSVPSLNLKTVQQQLDEYRTAHGLDSNFNRPVDPASQHLATGIQVLVGILILDAWIVFYYYLVRFLRNRRKTKSGHLPLQSSYGAWQGHNLGTTD